MIVPDSVLLLATLRSAPPLEMPVPLSVNGSALDRPLPVTVTAAPAATTVPVALPRAALLWTSTVPVLTVVVPVYVFTPLNASTPEPDLMMPPAPLTIPPTVSVVPASVTVTVRSAANDTAMLTVSVAPTALAVRPPAPRATELPVSV